MFTPTYLADGQLANAKGTIYTVPTGMRAKITSIVYYNTTGGLLVCHTYINGGTSREIHSVPLAGLAYFEVVTKPFYLDAADLLEANTSAATSVNYHVFGKLEQKG